MCCSAGVPASHKDYMRIGIAGATYSIPCLTFGYTRSPAIPQELLGSHIATLHPGTIIIVQYLDMNVLLVNSDWSALADHLVEKGWLISYRSVCEPGSSTLWMGEVVHGADHSILTIPSSSSPWLTCESS